MQRPFFLALAALMAVGAAVTTLAPANAASIRAMPALAEPAGTAGIEQVRHRRDRDWGHRRYSDNRWGHHRYKRSHRPYAAYPPFYFPYFAPPRHQFYFGSPPRRHYRNW